MASHVPVWLIMHLQNQWTAWLLGKQPGRQAGDSSEAAQSILPAGEGRTHQQQAVPQASCQAHHQLELGHLLLGPLLRHPGPRTPGGRCWELGGMVRGALGWRGVGRGPQGPEWLRVGGRGEGAEPHRWEPRRWDCPRLARTLLTDRPATVQCCISNPVGRMTYQTTCQKPWTWWVGMSELLPGKHPPSLACNPAERPCFITEHFSVSW